MLERKKNETFDCAKCISEGENAVYPVYFLSGDWVKPSEIPFPLAPSPALPLAETLRG